MKTLLKKLALSGAVMFEGFFLSFLFDEGSAYNAFISVAAVAGISFIGHLILIIISLIADAKGKADDIVGNARLNQLVDKISKSECKSIDESKVVVLFKLSFKELMAGEKITDSKGERVKKTSIVKNEVNRCAIELLTDLIFALNTENGQVYKAIKYNDTEKNTYFITDYDELNRCMEMNETVRAKYRRITSDNWKEALDKVK